MILTSYLIGYMIASNSSKRMTSNTTSEGVENSPQILADFHELFDPSKFESRFERNAVLLKLLSQASSQELQQFWQKSVLVASSTIQADLQRGIIQRYAALDPPAALVFVNSNARDSIRPELIDIVFREWSFKNLEEATATVRNLKQTDREIAVASMVRTRDDLSFLQRRELASQFDLEWIAFEIASQNPGNTVLGDPAGEWYRYFENRFDATQELTSSESRTLFYITYFWILHDGINALDSMLSTLPEDFSRIAMTKFVASKLLQSRPDLATNYVIANVNRESEHEYQDLTLEIFEAWANLKPELALDATFMVEKHSFRRELQTSVLKTLAQDDEFDLLTNIYSLPVEVRGLALEIALLETAKESPEFVSTMLANIDDIEERNRIAESVASFWARRHIQETLSWIKEDKSIAHHRENLIEAALKALVVRDSDLALQTALKLPAKRNNLGWEGIVFQELMMMDSDTALSMLPHMRAGNTLRDAYDWAILYFVVNENDVTKALDLLIELCEIEPKGTRVRSSFPFIAKARPREVFTRLDEIPSAIEKANLAAALLDEFKGKGSNIFSQDELNRLETFKRSRPLRDISPELMEATSEFYRLQRLQQD